jgi:phosphatidate cytidylyltransferase
MLKQRLITAVILIPLVIWGVYSLPANYLGGIFSAFVLLGAWEWSRLSEVSSFSMRILYVLIVALLIWNLKVGDSYFMGIMYIAAFWWLLALGWLRVPDFARNTNLKVKMVKLLAGMLVLLPTLMAIIYLHGSEQYGPSWLLYMMALAWVADSGAYFAGKRWGNHKLAPSISPGKTREGVYGSFVLIVPYALIGGYLLGLRDTDLWFFVVLSILLVPVSVLGDLFESLIKRHSGFKDSGVLLPGHGGVMDRIDSLTAVAPLFLLGLQVFI